MWAPVRPPQVVTLLGGPQEDEVAFQRADAFWFTSKWPDAGCHHHHG
jgi:hypothetical protein